MWNIEENDFLHFSDAYAADSTETVYVRFSDPRSITTTEGDAGYQYVRFTVSLTEAAGEVVTVHLDTDTYANSGWATEGVDYEGLHKKITFQPGQTTQTVKIKVFGDDTYEPDEMLVARLSDPSGAQLDPDQNLWNAFVHIENDDVPESPYVRFSDPRIAYITEGDAGYQYARFTVSLTEAAGEVVTVHLDTDTYANSGWATEGVDYEGLHKKITFQPGQTTQTVKIKVFGDDTYEPDEMLVARLSDPSGAQLDPDQNLWNAFVHIENDDVPESPYVRFSDPRIAYITEGDAGYQYARFTVSLTEAAGEVVTVHLDTDTYANSGWATEGVDYEGLHKKITFQPGQTTQTVKIKVFGDDTYEPDEMLVARLSDPSGAQLDPDQNLWNAFVHIENDDPAVSAEALTGQSSHLTEHYWDPWFIA